MLFIRISCLSYVVAHLAPIFVIRAPLITRKPQTKKIERSSLPFSLSYKTPLIHTSSKSTSQYKVRRCVYTTHIKTIDTKHKYCIRIRICVRVHKNVSVFSMRVHVLQTKKNGCIKAIHIFGEEQKKLDSIETRIAYKYSAVQFSFLSFIFPRHGLFRQKIFRLARNLGTLSVEDVFLVLARKGQLL